MKNSCLREFFNGRYGALVSNLTLALLFFTIERAVFLITNFSYYSANFTLALGWDMFRGGLVFDLSTMVYLNSLYVLLVLFPLHYKETRIYHKIIKWIFISVNVFAMLLNLGDAVYFQYTGRRTTSSVFSEFGNEGNIFGILMREMFSHWLLLLIFIILVYLLIRLYRTPKIKPIDNLWKYYIGNIVILACIVPICVAGARGGVDRTTRPITLSNANQYVNRPAEAAVVLNTPFSMLRTIGKTNFTNPEYFSAEELEEIYTPLHIPDTTKGFKPKNVVIFILESFSKEYMGFFNSELDNGTYKGYTPFMDSIASQSFTFKYSFGNGRKSIDGMPSVLSGIPMFIDPFILTSASMNSITSIAGELDKKGYHTAFFHGAPNGSMGFQAYSRTSGFQEYYGKSEYDARHAGNNDYDGVWAIWDEPFFQFYNEKISEFKQPFMTALFSASSHDPFAVPEKYKDKFPEEGGLQIHKCVRYSDFALRQFFEKAKHEDWFDNTLFVFTADHTNHAIHDIYKSDLGVYKIPIILYAPGDSTLRGYDTEKIAQQIDIMPTVLSYLGYNNPYISFGSDLLTVGASDTWAVNYLGGIYQFIKGDYMLQFDGSKVLAVYRYKTDPLLKHNELDTIPKDILKNMERQLKAIIQQYMTRMQNDNLTVKQKNDNE